MQLKNNKILAIVFRICIYVAFFTGLMYFVKFVNAPDSGSREKAFAAVSSFFYAYMVFTVVSFVLSIVCFKTTSTISSVVRTVSLAVISIILLMNRSFISLMNKALQAQSGNFGSYDELMELSNKAANLTNSTGIIFLLSFAGVFVMLVLGITSVVALVKTLKAKPTDVA